MEGGGVTNPRMGCTILLFGKIFTENCMEMKEIEPRFLCIPGCWVIAVMPDTWSLCVSVQDEVGQMTEPVQSRVSFCRIPHNT